MDIKIATQWAVLLFCSGLCVLLLGMLYALVWRMFNGKEQDLLSLKHAYRMWSEYNERHDKLSKLNKTNAELHKQVANLKRELEERKGETI